MEEIDGILHSIASGCRYSAPSVRKTRPASHSMKRELELGRLYTLLSARDAKWLTRLVLKNYQPVVLDPATVYRACHRLLPMIIQVQDDLDVAAHFLRDYYRRKLVAGGVPSRDELARFLKPSLGVKVGRPMWLKGRSIKHCLDISYGRMHCEEKVDGEYCQIHIDLSKGRDCIQIFSKSGKDSTQDRIRLHNAIRTSLRIGQPSCPLKTGCILEGELVVFSDKERKILDFHKIRKHVSRSGRYIGVDWDSQPHDWEHLMIVYFDALMIDGESLLGVKHSERFKRLGQLVTCKQGRSTLVKSSIIDCENRNAASDLRRLFAQCITSRQEGLVLKADDPYFDFSTIRRDYSGSCIKLKKEYVGSFGDVGDFAVVGARYDAVAAKTHGIPNLKWTHFFIGCLENKQEVQRWNEVPRFVVTNVVELNTAQMKYFTNHVNPTYVPESENESIRLRINPGVDSGKHPSLVFPEPPVFDMRCFSFEKAGNNGFWGLRFPQVNKVHCDRSYRDGMTFSELQAMAKAEKEMPPPKDSQELLGFIAALERADPRGVPMDAVSQLTASTASGAMTPPSSIPSSVPQFAQVQAELPVPKSHPRPISRTLQSTTSRSTTNTPTPPVSSGARPVYVENSAVEANPSSNQSSQQSLKRRLDSPKTPRQPKSRKCAASSSPPQGSSQKRKSRSRTPRSVEKIREPLADITASSQSQDNSVVPHIANPDGVRSFYETSMEDKPLTSSHRGCATPVAHPPYATPERPVWSPSVEIPDSQPCSASSTRTIQAGALDEPKKCVHCPDTCALAGISFLLAPCISKTPWLTDDLLSSHGIRNFVVSPDEWAQVDSGSPTRPSPAAENASTRRNGIPDQSSPRPKKVVLVESRRKEATEVLFRQIKQAGLKRRGGSREYVPVFDWRLLEELTTGEAENGGNNKEQDVRFDMKNAQSIWRKYWVGLA